MIFTIKTIPKLLNPIQYIEISHLVLERSRECIKFTTPVMHGSVLVMIRSFISDNTEGSFQIQDLCHCRDEHCMLLGELSTAWYQVICYIF